MTIARAIIFMRLAEIESSGAANSNVGALYSVVTVDPITILMMTDGISGVKDGTIGAMIISVTGIVRITD